MVVVEAIELDMQVEAGASDFAIVALTTVDKPVCWTARRKDCTSIRQSYAFDRISSCLH